MPVIRSTTTHPTPRRATLPVRRSASSEPRGTSSPRAVWRSPMPERPHTTWLTVTPALGAIALLVIGGIHYQQYRYAFYSAIPTIGPLFLLNFVGATTLGLFLLAPGKARLGHPRNSLEQLTAVAGSGLAASGLAALLISEHTPLFGFMEHGYRFVIVLTITSEATAITMLTLFLVRTRAQARSARSAPRPERRGDPIAH